MHRTPDEREDAGREGMHGTTQDPMMHAARDKVTSLRNMIMKHCGSTQQFRHTSARLLVAFRRMELLSVRSGVVQSSLVERSTLSSNLPRHDHQLMPTTFHFCTTTTLSSELDSCKLDVFDLMFLIPLDEGNFQ